MGQKIRYAVVGLGWIAQEAVLPAFIHAKKNSQLVALVSDDPVKLQQLSKKYNVHMLYSYDEYDECLKSGQIDAVYIALPNNMHADFTIRAAKAGIHVLCEKPMAMTEQECQKMIKAAQRNRIKLMIAYRLHFEESNLKAVHQIQKKKIGDVRIFNSVFTMPVQSGNIRLDKEFGGGTLYDIGIYCINACRYLFSDEPIEVSAFTSKGHKVTEVDEMTSAILRFSNNRLATFVCSFGTYSTAYYEVVGTKGILRVERAYHHNTGSTHIMEINEKKERTVFPKRDQFAPELIYFSKCILTGKNPEPSGKEGLGDVHIIRSLYKSAQLGRSIQLKEIKDPHKPNKRQIIKRPGIKKPKLIHAQGPKK